MSRAVSYSFIPTRGVFNSDFGIWLSVFFRWVLHTNHNVLRKHRVEHISGLRNEATMRQARVVSEKHGMTDLILALKDMEIKA